MHVPPNVERIHAELRALGYKTRLRDSPQGVTVEFSYEVEAGRYEGRSFHIGISMQGSEQYPEYPPHWVHIHPPIDDDKGGAIVQYDDTEGRTWTAISRPPGQLWDELPTKHMAAYIQEHIRRLWNGMK